MKGMINGLVISAWFLRFANGKQQTSIIINLVAAAI
jgi:hypothetical protein